RKGGIFTLVGDVQVMRQFAYLLALRSRLEMADRDHAKAVYTFQTGLAMSRHVADGPTAITTLVAAALAQLTLATVEELSPPPGEVKGDKKLELVGKVLQRYPEARKALLDQGRKAEDIDALPMLQVVLIYHHQLFSQARDDQLKWFTVPYWQARKGLEKADA